MVEDFSPIQPYSYSLRQIGDFEKALNFLKYQQSVTKKQEKQDEKVQKLKKCKHSVKYEEKQKQLLLLVDKTEINLKKYKDGLIVNKNEPMNIKKVYYSNICAN